MSPFNQVKAFYTRFRAGRRARRAGCQPADIANRLKEAAEEKKKIFQRGIFVPEKYRIYLSPKALDSFQPFLKHLRDELTADLTDYIRRKAYRLNTPELSIRFVPDDQLAPGKIMVKAEFKQADE